MKTIWCCNQDTETADVGIQWDPNDILGEKAVDVVPCEASAE